MAKIKGLLVKINDNQIKTEVVEFSEDLSNRLDEIYQLIGCNCIDIIQDKNDNDIVIDDEGLLKENHVFKLSTLEQPIAGDFIIFGKVDKNGNLTSYKFDTKIEIKFLGYINVS